MLDLDVKVFDTAEQSVEVTAIAHGLYHAVHEDKSIETKSCYATGYTVEELISDISMELALEFYEKYGEKCEVTYIRIEDAETVERTTRTLPIDGVDTDHGYDADEEPECGDVPFWEVAAKILSEHPEAKIGAM